MNWKFWQSKKEDVDFTLLRSVLESQLAQSSLFSPPQYTKEKNLSDAKHIVEFTRTPAYNAFASEGWTEVVGQLKRICSSTNQRDVDQAVGGLRSALHLLAVSFSARRMLEKQAKESSSPTHQGVKQGA